MPGDHGQGALARRIGIALTLRVAVLGAGAIARHLLAAVARGDAGQVEVVALAARAASADRAADLGGRYGVAVTTNPPELLAHDPDVVVEAASAQALREHGPALGAGADLLVMSVGALLDPELAERLAASAAHAGRHVHVPSGAIGGLDALQAARIGGLDEVVLTTSKPPVGLIGAPFFRDHPVDLAGLRERVVLFEGTAREAVREFPANVNVAAAVSLAGVGPEQTLVRVVADPSLERNVHEIAARGAFGELRLRVENRPNPDNPRTSLLACLSAAAALRRLTESVRIG